MKCKNNSQATIPPDIFVAKVNTHAIKMKASQFSHTCTHTRTHIEEKWTHLIVYSTVFHSVHNSSINKHTPCMNKPTNKKSTALRIDTPCYKISTPMAYTVNVHILLSHSYIRLGVSPLQLPPLRNRMDSCFWDMQCNRSSPNTRLTLFTTSMTGDKWSLQCMQVFLSWSHGLIEAVGTELSGGGDKTQPSGVWILSSLAWTSIDKTQCFLKSNGFSSNQLLLPRLHAREQVIHKTR